MVRIPAGKIPRGVRKVIRTASALAAASLLAAPLVAHSQIAVAPAASSPRDDGQWTMPSKDYANTRYSELTEITPQNARNLKVAFTVSSGTMSGQESAPIVVGDTLYFVTPYPNILFAVDLHDGRVKWRYEPHPDASAQGAACCEAVNRGPIYDNGTIFYNTIDDQTVAVDAKTGKKKWQVKLDDFNRGSTMTGAPFVVHGKVLVGNSGAEFGARGWLTALNEADGSIAWRAYATGSDKDVLIDQSLFQPFYPQYKGIDLGIKQWPADAWRIGGGTSWGWVSFDPDQDLIFYGTSNPSPWNDKVRPGDNLWTDGIFARNPETGKARWYYQFSPHDLWDHSAINENILLDMPWQGRMRKVVIRPDRNGYVYVIDRVTGQVLSAEPFSYVNDALGVDLKTGRLIDNPAKTPQMGEVMRNVCPNAPGSKDWNPSAFSKQTGLIYIPHNNLCMDWELTDVSYIAGTPYIGVETHFYPGPGGNGGLFTAWDPVNHKKVWEIKERWPVFSAAAATAGGLVFYGDLEGNFKAVDARTGSIVWSFQTGSGIVGQPTVFKGPDGHEYVAILSGIGGWVGGIVVNNLDPDDRTAQKGFANMTGPLKDLTQRGGTLYVFALPH